MPELISSSPRTIVKYSDPYGLVDPDVVNDEIFDRMLNFGVTNYLTEILTLENHGSYREMSLNEIFAEYVWVVMASGYKATIVMKYWKEFSRVLHDFDPIQVARLGWVELPIRHQAKTRAILKTARWIYMMGRAKFEETYLSSIDKMTRLPFIGEITKFHLARNLGYPDVVKPDLHLVRLARHLKYSTPYEMVVAFQEYVRTARKDYFYKISTLDFICWRYCADHGSSKLRQGSDKSTPDPVFLSESA